jgi:flagellar basal-body rod modification protein FlgD
MTGTTTLETTSLMRDKVDAVNTGGTSLTVELERSGRVAYNQITALD